MSIRHSKEEKLAAVSKVKSDTPMSMVMKEYGINDHALHIWMERYSKYGEDGLSRKRNINATGYDKEVIVREFMEKGVIFAGIDNKV